jgi:hypothetical protein
MFRIIVVPGHAVVIEEREQLVPLFSILTCQDTAFLISVKHWAPSFEFMISGHA